MTADEQLGEDVKRVVEITVSKFPWPVQVVLKPWTNDLIIAIVRISTKYVSAKIHELRPQI